MKKISCLFLIAGLSGCFGRKPEQTGLEGKPLPSFTVFLADSSTYFNTGSITTGKPTVLFYFGPYCPYCQAELLQVLKNMKSLKDIQFCMFTSYPYSDMKKFYDAYHLNKYSNIRVGVDTGNFFASYFKTPGIPYVAIYDKNKNLKHSFTGNVPVTQIKEVAED